MPHLTPLESTDGQPCSGCGGPAAALSRFVSVQTVAEALECSDDFVRDLLADGVLPYLDIARRTGKGKHRPKIRIPVARVEAYLEAQLRTAPKAVSA